MENITRSFCFIIIFIAIVFFNTCEAADKKQTPVRPYTEAEQRMLDETNKIYDEMVGWARGGRGGRAAATEEDMISSNQKIDYWNPLYTDRSYASNTRWGGVIAHPLAYGGGGGAGGASLIAANPDVGNLQILDGVGLGRFETEWFRPVRPGDKFRNWNRRPTIEDITEGDGPRTFMITTKTDMINQKDELVSTRTSYTKATFYTDPSVDVNARPDLVMKGIHGYYTEEELALVKQIEDEEEIRGAEIRYWEDVNVGDQITPIIDGPTTVVDMMYLAGMGDRPMREIRKSGGPELLVDPDTNITHSFAEQHYGPLKTAETSEVYNGSHYNSFSRHFVVRLLTNWMGDDGFLKKMHTRLFQFGIELTRDIEMLKDRKTMGHDKIGDVLIGRGIVTGKRVENGEHLVDLVVWMEDLDGDIGTAAKATVRLLSKEEPYMEWMKDQR